jgi:signal recognition particle subunit SRP54
MGPLKKVMQMIPGVGVSIPEEQMKIGEEKLKKFKVIMQSMTKEEMETPKILNASRIRRVAKGSGTKESDVKELLKQYEFMQKFVKAFAKGRMPRTGPWAKMMKEISKKGPTKF